MEKSEVVKLLIAAVVGGLMKELVSWLISFTKVSLFGPMWKYSRKVLTSLFACLFYGGVLFRFSISSAAVTGLDVLLIIGSALLFIACALALLFNVAKWQTVREAVNSGSSAAVK